MLDYYDREGKPITSHEEFIRMFGDKKYKRVAFDEVGDTRISTVWLGMDHSFTDEGPPIIFETMTFGGPYDEYQWRYATEDEALAGHERILAAIRDGRDPDA